MDSEGVTLRQDFLNKDQTFTWFLLGARTCHPNSTLGNKFCAAVFSTLNTRVLDLVTSPFRDLGDA